MLSFSAEKDVSVFSTIHLANESSKYELGEVVKFFWLVVVVVQERKMTNLLSLDYNKKQNFTIGFLDRQV